MSDNTYNEVKILAVEDDPGDFGLIRVYLHRAGYGVEAGQNTLSWATTLADAKNQSVLNKPDIVLLDLNLPDSSGLNTVNEMRNVLPGVPIIVLSGNEDNEIALNAFEEGANEYVVKGHYEHDALGKAISHTLARAKLEARLKESEFRWKFALEGAGDGVWDWDLTLGKITYSKRWYEIQGFNEGEIGSTPNDWKKLVHQDDLLRVTATLQNHLEGNSSNFSCEHRVRCKNGEYKWILGRGMVVVRNAQGEPLRIIGTHSDITERKQMEEQIRQLAFFDTLTKLPNRRLLEDRLSQAMASSKRTGLYGALIFLDLDNFKPLNDTWGHTVGDLLLSEVASRLKLCVREMDTVARFGGDEFVVILNGLESDKDRSASQALIVADKIRKNLADTYLLFFKQEGKPDVMVEHHCTASIGVALFCNHEDSVDEIVKRADSAMYLAKNSGRNSIRFDAKE